MNRYDPGTPRMSLAIGAAAVATITLGLLVAMPAQRGYEERASSAVTAMHGWAAKWIARAPSQAGTRLPGKPATQQTSGKGQA